MNETAHFTQPGRWGTLQPKFIVSLVALLGLLGLIAGYIEITQSRKDVMELLRLEAETVTDALSISAENAVRGYGEIESHIEKQLLNTARLLNHLIQENQLSQSAFQELMRESGAARALYVSHDAELLDFAYASAGEKTFDRTIIAQFIEPLFRSKINKISGYVRDWEGQNHFAVGFKTTGQTAWVLCANPGILLQLRKRVGLGRLIQDIGQNKDVAYIVLQDERGIVAATANITTMPSIRSDAFLQQAMTGDALRSRVTPFADSTVFETVKPFSVSGQTFGLIRVGLRMDAVNRAVTHTIERAIAVIFGFIIIGVVLFNFMVSNQNYELLTKAYSKITTYTGNILANMADAVIAVDATGKITLFNHAAETLFEQPAASAMGRFCQDIIGQQTSLLDQALRTGREVRDQEVTYRLNGRTAILSVTTTLLRNQAGGIDSAVAVIKDLTEKKTWEERLRRQEKLTSMGELASGVAHEIRNPLNAISIIAQRFANEFEPAENAEEYHDLAHSVVSATRQVSATIEQFLKFARPPELNLQKHCLTDVVEKMVTLVKSQLREKKIQLTFEATDRVEMFLDASQMEEVLLNLLQNSLHATPAGGAIHVVICRQNHEAIVEISDTGVGIPPDNLGRIFDLYFTTRDDGTGMGLSVAHRIVTEHGGRITVQSEVERGTTFAIVLPLKNEPTEPRL